MTFSIKTVFGAAVIAVASLSTGAAIADGDPVAGKKVFNKCKACHTLAAPSRPTAPHLGCIIGRPAATVEEFKYSDAMKESGLTWDKETIDVYLSDPKALVPKTKMSQAGKVRTEQQREDLIAYLEQETGGGEGCGY